MDFLTRDELMAISIRLGYQNIYAGFQMKMKHPEIPWESILHNIAVGQAQQIKMLEKKLTDEINRRPARPVRIDHI